MKPNRKWSDNDWTLFMMLSKTHLIKTKGANDETKPVKFVCPSNGIGSIFKRIEAGTEQLPESKRSTVSSSSKVRADSNRSQQRSGIGKEQSPSTKHLRKVA